MKLSSPKQDMDRNRQCPRGRDHVRSLLKAFALSRFVGWIETSAILPFRPLISLAFRSLI